MTTWALGVYSPSGVADTGTRCEALTWAEAVRAFFPSDTADVTLDDLTNALPGKVATPHGTWFVVNADHLDDGMPFVSAVVDQLSAGDAIRRGAFA